MLTRALRKYQRHVRGVDRSWIGFRRKHGDVLRRNIQETFERDIKPAAAKLSAAITPICALLSGNLPFSSPQSDSPSRPQNERRSTRRPVMPASLPTEVPELSWSSDSSIVRRSLRPRGNPTYIEPKDSGTVSSTRATSRPRTGRWVDFLSNWPGPSVNPPHNLPSNQQGTSAADQPVSPAQHAAHNNHMTGGPQQEPPA